jgi:hypothetical protein
VCVGGARLMWGVLLGVVLCCLYYKLDVPVHKDCKLATTVQIIFKGLNSLKSQAMTFFSHAAVSSLLLAAASIQHSAFATTGAAFS